MEKAQEEFKKLTRHQRHFLILQLMKEKQIDFTEFSNIYIQYLQEKDKENNIIISGLSIPLLQFWLTPNLKPKRQEIFIRCKAAYNLLKGKMFHTALIEKDLQKLVDKHKYTEDENGHHSLNQ